MPSPRRNHNLCLVLPDGSEKWSGKIVHCDGAWHFHVTAQSGWRLVKAAAWGIQQDVLDHCARYGVSHIHIFDKGEQATYSVALLDLLACSTEGYNRAWGRMRELHEADFDRTPGRVAASRVWVPEPVFEVIYHTSAPGGLAVEPVLDETDEPTPTQALLPF